jgi:hypothetical protein
MAFLPVPAGLFNKIRGAPETRGKSCAHEARCSLAAAKTPRYINVKAYG